MDDKRFEPGARWERHGKRLTVTRESYLHGMPWVHFGAIHEAFEHGELTEANGWTFIGPPEASL